MPFELHCDSSPVVVQGKVYMGGGKAYKNINNYIVMEYDIRSEKWAILTPYRAKDFVMTAIDNQLVLVGGANHGLPIKALVCGELILRNGHTHIQICILHVPVVLQPLTLHG